VGKWLGMGHAGVANRKEIGGPDMLDPCRGKRFSHMCMPAGLA
jgi:hypothetical protein